MIVHRWPIQWYADKIARGEPFSLLMYGDGEFMVASGQHVGGKLAFGEVVTQGLVDEMRLSFSWSDGIMKSDGEGDFTGFRNEILRASDPNIIDPDQYMGRDRDMMWGVHRKASPWISQCQEWHDGVAWDVAAREGGLGPFLKALRKREVVFIGNPKVADALVDSGAVRLRYRVEVPEQDAAASIDRVEANAAPNLRAGMVVLVCVGLSGIPLVMRLRRACSEATVMDLGSVFDVFARIGEQRGWRKEMYADEAAWRECLRKNLEGS